jgi:hypothetical protein
MEALRKPPAPGFWDETTCALCDYAHSCVFQSLARMLVPKVVTALRTLIPLDEVRTDGRGLLLEGKWRHKHHGPLEERVPCDLLVCLQVKACEALEALDEMLETELPIINPHLSEVLTFCLEVSPGWVLLLLAGLPLSFLACF